MLSSRAEKQMDELRKSMFGSIAVIGGYINEDQLAECLDDQHSGGTEGSNVRLGELMKQKGLIDDSGIEDVLFIQKRLNTGLFGEIAIRLNFADIDKIEEALMYQSRERDKGNDPGKLGEILIQYEVINQGQCDIILQEQNLNSTPCPECGTRNNTERLAPGQKIDCSHCGALIEIKGASPLQPEKTAQKESPVSLAPPKIPGYTVGQQKAETADGLVFEAVQDNTNWDVLVEVLTGISPDDKEFRTRFYDEAQKAISMNHPAVKNVFGVGEHEGRLYIITQYIKEAEGLYSVLKREHVLPTLGATQIVIQIADALKAATDVQLIHGDLKTSEILICKDGSVKLARLGVAKRYNLDLLGSESVLQTSSYTAPEVLIGKQIPDNRCDIYSLGVIFFQLLTGEVPFPGANAREILMSMTRGTHQVLLDANLAGYLCGPLEDMLALDRHARIDSWDKVVFRLRAVENRLTSARGPQRP